MGSTTPVTVYLANETTKTVPVSTNTTFAQLNVLLGAKLELPEDVYELFAVFHVQVGYERMPSPSERVLAVVNAFASDAKAFKKKKKKLYKYRGESRLVYKKALQGRRKELLCTALPALTLLYYQAQADVVQSRIPTHGPDAIELAGIQMQIDFGDYDDSVRTPGYLAEHGILDKYVPARSLANKLHTTDEWETVIFQHYAEHYGKTQEEAIRSYLNTARRSKFYGGRIFLPAKCFHQGQLISTARVQGIIASNQFMLIDPKSQKTLWSFPFSSLREWKVSADGTSFAFYVVPKNKQKLDPFVLETPQAAYIAQSLTDAAEEAASELNARKLESIAAFKAAKANKTAAANGGMSSSLRAIDKWKRKAGLSGLSAAAAAAGAAAPADSSQAADSRPVLSRKIVRTRKADKVATPPAGSRPAAAASAADAAASGVGASSSAPKATKRIRVRRRKKPKSASSHATPAVLASSTL